MDKSYFFLDVIDDPALIDKHDASLILIAIALLALAIIGFVYFKNKRKKV